MCLVLTLTTCLLLSFTACSKDQKREGEAFANRGWASYQAHQYFPAEQEMQQAIRRDPENPEYHYRLGLIYRDSGKDEPAAGEFFQAHKLKENYKDSVQQLAHLQLHSNDLQTVGWSGDFERWILTKSTDPKERAEAYYVLGVGSIRLGDPAAADDNFNKALNEDPGHAAAASLLALEEADRGHVNTAEQILRTALSHRPDSVTLNSSLAEFLRMAGKPDQAEAQWKRVLELDSRNIPAYLNLIDVLSMEGRSAEAEEFARSVGKQSGAGYDHWHALLLLRNGKKEEAASELRQLSKAAPRDQTARLRLVSALIALGKPIEAAAQLDDAEKQSGRSADLVLMRAQLALSQRDSEQAATLVGEAMRLDPASGQAHLLAAQVADLDGNSTRAKYELGEALRLEPGLQAARLALVRYYVAQSDFENALGILDGVLPAQRSSYAVLVQRLWTLMAQGVWSQASSVATGLATIERSPEVSAQRFLTEMALRNQPAATENSIQLALFSSKSPVASEAMQLITTHKTTPEEIKAFSTRFGSQPLWENFRSDLLVLPRGVFRSSFDPDGVLNPRSFGLWQPIMNEN